MKNKNYGVCLITKTTTRKVKLIYKNNIYYIDDIDIDVTNEEIFKNYFEQLIYKQ